MGKKRPPSLDPGWDIKKVNELATEFAYRFRDNLLRLEDVKLAASTIEQEHINKTLQKSDIHNFVKEGENPIDKAFRAKKEQRELRKKNVDAGPKWFGMKAPIMTPELETEVKLIKMQHVMDKNYRFRSADSKIPKHFEIGTVLEAPTEYYTRETKKQKNMSMADALLQRVSDSKRDRRKGIWAKQSRKLALMRTIAQNNQKRKAQRNLLKTKSAKQNKK